MAASAAVASVCVRGPVVWAVRPSHIARPHALPHTTANNHALPTLVLEGTPHASQQQDAAARHTGRWPHPSLGALCKLSSGRPHQQPAGHSMAAGAIAWTPLKVVTTVAIFLFAGLAEIGGGWLVWQTVREKKPWWYLVIGFAVLCAYGLIPTLQPAEASFSRVYAVYGGVFILLAYAWGWAVDGDRPDIGDGIGTALAIAGVLVAWFWPRATAAAAAATVDPTTLTSVVVAGAR